MSSATPAYDPPFKITKNIYFISMVLENKIKFMSTILKKILL